MKKKILSLGVAIVLIVCTFATLSACGRKLKDREITPTIEDIWQDIRERSMPKWEISAIIYRIKTQLNNWSFP